ncbi:putative glutamate receptor [Paroedura picta]|uniref:putative glutamate receptor n=1 Tax=Paroedura picta TaxID=143630 RepID=UPI004056E6B3
MDKSLWVAICLGAALFLLDEPNQADATENGDSISKDTDSVRAGGKDLPMLYVTTILEDPYVMARDTELEGYCIDLLEKLSEMLHFRYKVGVVKDGKYGTLSPNGSWTGMIGEIVRKEADLAVAPLTITSSREDAVDFTQPFLHTGIGILLEKDTTLDDASLFHFLAPFSKEMWAGILAAYVVASLCLFLAARVSPCEWDGNEETPFTFLNSLWFGVGSLALQGAVPPPKSLSVRIISAIWWLFSIVLLTAYIAGFSFVLESGSEQLSIQTFEDLVKQRHLEFGTMAVSSTLLYFKNSKNPIQQMVYESMNKKKDTVLAQNYQEAIQRVLDSNYAFIGETVSQDLAVARHCNLVRSPEVLGARGFGIATPQGSPWTNKLSVAILKLGEAGDLDHLRSKWWESRCSHDDHKWSPLKPQTLGGIFLILALGLAIGMIVAVLELSKKSRRTAAQEKKSCCSVFTEELSQRFRPREIKKQEPAGKSKP